LKNSPLRQEIRNVEDTETILQAWDNDKSDKNILLELAKAD
ncbi:8523_t:CDS:2, partial [Cetraspora pellucida]